ncbi:MAG: lipopolysaccharide biosynthesis protein [Phycisphaerae bacterium]
MNQKTLIAINTGMSYLRQAVRLVIQLFMVRFIVDKVGKDEFGVYSQVLAISGLVMLLDLGVNPAVSRFMARELALKNDEACREIWLTALVAYLLPMTLILVGLPLAAPQLAEALIGDAAYRNVARALMAVAAVYFALQFPANAYKGVLLGEQRHFAVANVEIVVELVRAAILVLVLSTLTTSVVWVLVIYAGTQIAGNLVLVGMVHARFAWARFRRSAIRWERFRGVLTLSLTSFLAQAGFTLNLYVHRMIIGKLLGPAAVTYYYVAASTFRDMIENVVMQFATTTIPATAKYEATGHHDALAALMLRGTKYAVIMAGLIAAPIAAFSRPLLSIWMWKDPSYAAYAPLMVGVLGLTLLELTRGTAHAMLTGLARMGLLGSINFVAVVLDGVLAVVLIKTTSLGLYSILISIGAAVILRRTVITWHVCKLLNLSKRRLVLSSMAWPLGPALVAAGSGWLLQRWFTPHNWATLIVSGTACGLLGVLFAAFVTLNGAERRELATPLRSAWNRFGPKPQ